MYMLTHRYDDSRIQRLGLARNDIVGSLKNFPTMATRGGQMSLVVNASTPTTRNGSRLRFASRKKLAGTRRL